MASLFNLISELRKFQYFEICILAFDGLTFFSSQPGTVQIRLHTSAE